MLLNIRPTRGSAPRDEIIMTSNEAKATMLVINLDSYRLLKASPDFVDVQQISLMAANEKGQIFNERLVYTSDNGYCFADILESEDVPADILTFIEENFEEGKPSILVAADMDILLQYMLQSAPLAKAVLADAKRVYLNRLVSSLPANSLGYKDFMNGRSGRGRTVTDTLSTFLLFGTFFRDA